MVSRARENLIVMKGYLYDDFVVLVSYDGLYIALIF